MRLCDLLVDVPGVTATPDVDVREVHDDSRQVARGDLFVAVTGLKTDARTLIPDVLARRAAAVVLEPGGPDETAWRAAAQASGATLVFVPSARRALGIIAANRFGVARELTFSAITGTNGKTTTTHIVRAMLAAAARRPAIVGTVANQFDGDREAATMTTPNALSLHALLARWRAAGCTDVVMEATSQALDQGRLAGCRFRAAGLTNLTQDHLDAHGTMDAYFAAKAILFRELLTPDGVGVVPADREEGLRMAALVRGRTLTVSTSAVVSADVRVVEAQLDEGGTIARLATPMGDLELRSPLVGDFNLENLTLATGVGVALGLPLEAIAQGAAALPGVPGRLERVQNDAGMLCVVDYAHTPDGLERALAALRPLVRGRLLVVFGCGGDRDRGKRPIMGEIAARLADACIVTSDNPRTEDPATIVQQILEGVPRAGTPVTTELDRRRAIELAVEQARAGDGVLIAGKGHEDYQILGTTKVPFDDREIARAAFAQRGGA